MSISQPNQSLTDGIRCLQYTGLQRPCYRMSRACPRLMDIMLTRVNRLLMTMAFYWTHDGDEHRRYLPAVHHALAAQAIRGSALFSMRCRALSAMLQRHGGIRRAMGRIRLSIFITLRRVRRKSGAGGFRMCPARQSVTGVALAGGRKRRGANAAFYPEQWRNLEAPHGAAAPAGIRAVASR